MGLLVVGSIALDTVKTPFGKVKDALGGSATYFSTSASFFAKVDLVGVVGEDFSARHINFLKKRGVDLKGLKKEKGRTFRWTGEYEYDLNKANTKCTHLNVFSTFNPRLPEEYKKDKFVFLANIHPNLQINVLRQIKKPRLVACDSMNLWIETERKELLKLLKEVDLFVLNDSEARELTRQSNLARAARTIRSYGPRMVIIKKGEHGSLLFFNGRFFSAPAYPLEDVYDPTGAGDTFAGGLMGYLAKTEDLSEKNIRRGIIYGSVMASFVVEDFSLNRMRSLTSKDIRSRYKEFERLVSF
jgi:sugar/nucleoside kinase (ribokinase family)